MSAAPTNLPPQDGGGPAAGPATPSQRPPAPPPPPARAPSAADVPGVAEPGTGGTTAGGSTSQASRRHQRHRLSGDPPARVALANRQPVFVTLNDISPGGCCIVRKGQLELANGDTVLVDVWTQDVDTKLSIQARVCWCSHQDATSRAGLRFVETNHRLQRQIESYVERFRRRAEDSRPKPWIPSQAGSSGVEPPLPPPQAPAPPQPPPEFLLEFAPPSVPESAPRPRRGRQVGRRFRRTSHRRQLPAMPRPQPLNPVDLQRRMQAAHRQEVARIAEETGIHIHTLYGWLRALQLEGAVDPARPRDPEAWSATDKVSALLQVVGMSAAERSAWCSRHGIGEEQLERWRQAALQANEKPVLILRAEEELQRLQVRDQRHIRRLQTELRRLRREMRHLERSAAINAELLEVVRKLQNLWEQGEGQ